MSVERFVGRGTCEIGDLGAFTQLGQKLVVHDETLLKDILTGGGVFITEEDFECVGFTPAELDPKNRAARRTDEFTVKLAEAQQVYHDRVANYASVPKED